MSLARKIIQPILGHLLTWETKRLKGRFRGSLETFQQVQQETLLRRLARHAESSFGRHYDFAAMRTVEDFRRAMPLTSYADHEPFIENVRHGFPGAMFGPGTRIHMFAMTSGTTSRPKYIPVTDEYLKQYRTGWMTWGIHSFVDHPLAFESHILQLVSTMEDEKAPCGLPSGAISGFTAATQKRAARNVYSSPPCVAEIRDTAAKYYISLLMALRYRRLMIISANPSTLLGLARVLNDRRENLLEDLARGQLSPDLAVSDEIRFLLNRVLRPHKERARQLRQIVRDTGLLRPMDVWQLPFLGCWKGGTLGLYLRQFPEWFGDAPVRDIGLIASEGRMTIPLSDDGSAGVLDVQGAFFEFLPARSGCREGNQTLLPHEVEVGGEYFIILSTPGGLYRYDIGDLVRIDGFVGGSPLVTFLSKGAHTSSLTGEKLTEHQAVTAVNAAAAELSLNLTSYCLAPTWHDEQPFYTLLLETDDVGRSSAVADRLAAAVDQRLGELNIEYRDKRRSQRLGPVQPRLLAGGTWARHDQELMTARRRGAEQFKHQFLATDPHFEQRFSATEMQAV